jgi:hypothetical protein
MLYSLLRSWSVRPVLKYFRQIFSRDGTAAVDVGGAAGVCSPPSDGALARDDKKIRLAGLHLPRIHVLVWMACALAAVRVFLFSAAFPFFNNVDEASHFDMLLRHARGEPQPRLAPYSAEAAEYISLYGSAEFSGGPYRFEGKEVLPPTWMMTHSQGAARFRFGRSFWKERIDQEGASAPLYYAIAGAWWRLGERGGLQGINLLYWVRFLNIFFMTGIIWLGYWAARLVFTGAFPRVAAPLLLAFFPQHIFYSIQSDVLSPPFFGLAFIAIIKMSQAEIPGRGWAALAGSALAATVLVKASNLPLLGIALPAFVAWMAFLAKGNKVRQAMPAIWVCLASLLLPLGGWMLWNHCCGVGWTGTAPKVRALDWTAKPIWHWWPHPLFTLDGQGHFWAKLLASFWRGEFCWDYEPLSAMWSDLFYYLSSIIFVAVNVPALFRSGGLSYIQRVALAVGLCSLASLALFQAVSSIAFDFGSCEYPSRAEPFFNSGRLMMPALIPFMLLYARGLNVLLKPARRWWAKPGSLAAILLLVTVSEVTLNLPAFSSLYNFYHRVSFDQAAAHLPADYLVARPQAALAQREAR